MSLDRTFPYSLFEAPGLLGQIDRRPSRLSLDPSLAHSGMFDGAWWPRTRDLERELPALIIALRRRVGPVLHVSVERSAWDAAPGRVTVDGRVVRVNCFSSSLHTMGVGGGHQDHFLLLVVPPHTDATVARAAMACAARPGNSTPALRILTVRAALPPGTWPPPWPPPLPPAPQPLPPLPPLPH
ncbi:DUF5994 family protein [Kitasatospora sp. NPDC050543]|uniref:DUF5994 family protein n=1 Tax=Kitasatospora sp. NPDC050543 TaxID=3364054 RepID=UPI0037B32E86